MLVGLVAAASLAFLSYARVSFVNGKPVVRYRHPVVYGSSETLLVTQQGFPQGWASSPAQIAPQGAVGVFADQARFTSLADLYSYLANGDEVRALARRGGGDVAYSAAPVLSPYLNGAPEPILRIQGAALTPAAAARNAAIASQAFRDYLDSQQAAAHIPKSQRVMASVLNRATGTTILVPRKKTIAIVVFLAVLAASVAFVLVLENLRPRLALVDPSAATRDAADERRSVA